MNNKKSENALNKKESFRTLRIKAGLLPEKRSDGIKAILHNESMQNIFLDIIKMIQYKNEKLTKIETATNPTSATNFNNLIYLPRRAVNKEND